MNKEGTDTNRRGRTKALLIQLACMLAVLIAAVLVRMFPAVGMSAEPEENRAAYTDETGVPYLTDLDAYYHVRLVDNYLAGGSLGDSVNEDGKAWDTKSYYPEGRSAEYQPGIVWLTAGIWRLFGGSLAALEYRICAFVAALAALAAFWIGRRMTGWAGGLAAGVLVACAPLYVQRTCFGRFDTDMFIVLMELLLILFTTEALRAESWKGRIASAVGFALTAAVYSLCWTPTYSMLFAGLTLFGGLLFCLTPLFSRTDPAPRIQRFFKQPGLWMLITAGLLTLAGLLITTGPSVFSRILTGLSFTTSSGSGALPNLLASISELSHARFVPENFWLSFIGYVQGESPAIVNSLGGMVGFLLSLAGIVWLCLAGFTPLRGKNENLSPRSSALYFCVLTTWFFACLFLTGSGLRFVEHLSIPVGLLAGAFIGRLFAGFGGKKHSDSETGKNVMRIKAAARILIPVLVFAAAVIPAVSGSALAARDSGPSITDASAKAMQYIKTNAQDPDAVVASWWDMGYFYESESGHPCLWDGGTQNGARAILVSKALTTDSMELSRRIFLMLSASGNRVVDLLMEHTDGATAFDTLWKALLMKKEAALPLLIDQCSLNETEAEEVWAMMRPAEPKETYVILTYSMAYTIGWFEYYAGWDFSGKQPPPVKTIYTYSPDGLSLSETEAGRKFKENVRSKEMFWRLFFDAEQTACFTPVFEWHDTLEHVRVWKVES